MAAPGDFYIRYANSVSLVRGYAAILDAVDIYLSIGDRARAQALDLELARMQRQVRLLAERTARNATAAIQRRIDATQVRPSTPGPGHLRDRIVSRALPGALPGGGVGVAEIVELDKTINPRTPKHGPYWLAQEVGTGRTDPATGISVPSQLGRPKPTPGYFEPGGAHPDMADFRAHPYFEQQPYAKGMPALVITREIRPRHFLRDGADQALTQHRQSLGAIERSAARVMSRIAGI